MRFMILVKADKNSEAGILPSQELLDEMGKYNEELIQAGVMLAGEGLHASSKGTRITFSKRKHTVVDGPFSDANDLIAGYWLWEVESKDNAIEWVKRAPFGEGAEIEIRQVFEAEDFGPELTPELREREQRQRAQSSANRK